MCGAKKRGKIKFQDSGWKFLPHKQRDSRFFLYINFTIHGVPFIKFLQECFCLLPVRAGLKSRSFYEQKKRTNKKTKETMEAASSSSSRRRKMRTGGAAIEVLDIDSMATERQLIDAILSECDSSYFLEDVAPKIFSAFVPADFIDGAACKSFEFLSSLFVAGKLSGEVEAFNEANLRGAEVMAALIEATTNKMYGIDERAIVCARRLREIIERRAVYRQILQITDACAAGKTIREAVDSFPLEKAVGGSDGCAENPLAETKAVVDACAGVREILSGFIPEQGRSIALGVGMVDGVLDGGVRGGQVIIVGGRPAAGKTAFALSCAYNMACAGACVVFCSLEMTAWELNRRLVRHGAHGNERGTIKIIERAANAEAMLAAVKKIAAREKVAAVFIDYLQLIRSSSVPASASPYVMATETSRLFKPFAKEMGVPVVVLSQLNRASENERRAPRPSDLRDSGQIEQDADVILLLSKDELKSESEFEEFHIAHGENATPVLLQVAKNRNGRTVKGTYVFDGATGTFTPQF